MSPFAPFDAQTQVLLIDDDPHLRQALRQTLDLAGLKVATLDDARQLDTAQCKDWPGVVVSDIRMPGIDGMELLRQLHEQDADLPVILITGHGDVPLAVEAMKAGVADFLEKPFDDEALLSAVRAALDTRVQDDRQDAERQKFESMLAGLSPREQDVLRGVVAGKPNKIIAFELGISPRTVEVYRANVMTKTGASSLSELVRMALLAGF